MDQCRDSLTWGSVNRTLGIGRDSWMRCYVYSQPYRVSLLFSCHTVYGTVTGDSHVPSLGLTGTKAANMCVDLIALPYMDTAVKLVFPSVADC